MVSGVDATADSSGYDNATVGEGTLIEPDVILGFRYHPKCGRTILGKGCRLGKETVIYGDVTIGDHFNSGLYAVIRALVKMGNTCALGNGSTIEGIVRLGDGVRIMSHVYIPSRTWIGSHVFIGPGTTFLNDRYPYRRDPAPTPRGATIEDDVMIGGGVTILPEVHIGERSFIAAGAVVKQGRAASHAGEGRARAGTRLSLSGSTCPTSAASRHLPADSGMLTTISIWKASGPTTGRTDSRTSTDSREDQYGYNGDGHQEVRRLPTSMRKRPLST